MVMKQVVIDGYPTWTEVPETVSETLKKVNFDERVGRMFQRSNTRFNLDAAVGRRRNDRRK
jgi:adenylate kinase family enzyme